MWITAEKPSTVLFVEPDQISENYTQLRAGHPDVEGLCLALADWSAELRLLLAARTKMARCWPSW
jgi:hypothetical protein